jgi:hypothetical protein
MLKLAKDTRFVLVAAVAVAALLGGLAMAVAGNKSQAPLPVGDVAASSLAGAGITLTPASAATPNAGAVVSTASKALEIAAGDSHVQAKAGEYVHCDDPNAAPPVSQDCWAVSIDPSQFHSHGPSTGTPIQATYAVELIDPATGQVLDRADGAP